MKKVKDITLQEIKEGINWRVYPSFQPEVETQDWEVEPKKSLNQSDHVAYSALFVTKDGTVQPLILIKEVSSLDYGGDYLEYKNGSWQQVGIVPNREAQFGEEYIANPLDIDPSFTSDQEDFRKYHEENFKKWINSIS